MIRIACPKCAERLVLEDDTAGLVGQCPECDAQFRIPGTELESIIPVKEADELERSGRRFHGVQKRPRRKKRKAQPHNLEEVLERINFTIVFGILGAVAIVTLLLAAVWSPLAILPLAFGLFVMLIGGFWCLICAFNVCIGWGIGVLLPLIGNSLILIFPSAWTVGAIIALIGTIVAIYFLVLHFYEVRHAFLAYLIGVVMVWVGGGLAPRFSAGQQWHNLPVNQQR